MLQIASPAKCVPVLRQSLRSATSPVAYGAPGAVHRRHQQHRHRQSRVFATASEVAGNSTAAGAMTEWCQKSIELSPYKRGCHVITRNVLDQLPEIRDYECGLANFFILHTSASLTINENASPDVPLDLNDALDRIVPESKQYRHLDEGMDDMPAHVKSSLMGPSLTVPIRYGKLALGTWQGLYLNEHRNYGGPRTIMVTIQGKKREDGKSYSKW